MGNLGTYCLHMAFEVGEGVTPVGLSLSRVRSDPHSKWIVSELS